MRTSRDERRGVEGTGAKETGHTSGKDKCKEEMP